MSSAADTATLDSADLRRRDWLTILLIGIAHASSHFFQLVLPSLYVSLGTAFDLDFARLETRKTGARAYCDFSRMAGQARCR